MAHSSHVVIPDSNDVRIKNIPVDLERQVPEVINAETSTYSLGEHQGDGDPTR